MTYDGSMFGPRVRKPRWTGSRALVCLPPGCPECAGPLIEMSVAQPALFRHGGYGATLRITWSICTNGECRWSLERQVQEVDPRL